MFLRDFKYETFAHNVFYEKIVVFCKNIICKGLRKAKLSSELQLKVK